MATRKDLLKAQAFTSRRMIAAFVDRDPDDPTPPLRRVGTATFVSILLGVVLLAGTALIGMLGGGVTNKSWKDSSPAVLSNTESGSLFVWNGSELVPMADIASARLAAVPTEGDPDGAAPIIRVKTEALTGETQLPMMGIPGAPRQMPDADSLHGYPVRFCSSAPTGLGRYLTLEFGAGQSTDPSMAFVAESDSGEAQFLVQGGRRHALPKSQSQRSSPLVGDLPVVTPGNSWIEALPLGAAISAIQIPQRGEEPAAEAALRNLRIGQFAKVEGSPDRYYVMLREGLVRIAYLDMRAIQEQSQEALTETTITESELSGSLHPTTERISHPDIPLDQPVAPEGYDSLESQSVCATFTEDRPGLVELSVGQPTPTLPAGIDAPAGDRIDLVAMESLTGALLRSDNALSEDGPVTLVVGGMAYPIPDARSRTALGYHEAQAAAVTPQLLNLLPAGLTERGASLSMDSVVQVGGQ